MDFFKDEVDEEDQEVDLEHDRYGGKDAVIFLIDASSRQMHEKGVDSEDTNFQMALRCAHATLQRKIFGTPNDVVGVLLYGTQEMVGVKDFENMSVLLPLDNPEGKSIKDLEDYVEDLDALQSLTGKFNESSYKIHEALWQCQSMFNEVKGKIASKKILLFTTNDRPHCDEPSLKKQAMKKGKDLIDTDISLEIVPFSNSFAFNHFYKEIAANEDIVEESEVSQENSATIVAEECFTRKLDDMLRLVRKRVYKKRSIGKCHLDLGSGVKLAVSTYNFVQRATKPSKVRLTRDTNEDVKILRQYLDESSGAPLLPSDIGRYMEYAHKKIKFTQDEIRAMQKSLLGGSYGFKLICFKPESELKWSDFVRSCHFIYPDDDFIKGSRNLFAALLIKCAEKKVIAVCSYKARETSLPFYVALDPQLERKDPKDGSQIDPPGFRVFYLPFVDDYRPVPDPMPMLEPSDAQVDSAIRVIKKLKMKHYDVEQFENPGLQAHFKMIESLALLKTTELEFVDTTLPDFEMQAKRLGDRAQAFNDAVEPDARVFQHVKGNTKEKVPNKRSASSNGSHATKKAKLDDVPIDSGQMEKLVEMKRVDTLKVDELKTFLKSVGCAVTNKKKAALVQDVYDHFVI